MVKEDEKTIRAWEEELTVIQSFLETETSDEPAELIERLGVINVYLARTSKILADAKFLQDAAAKEVFDNLGTQVLDSKPTIVMKFIGSLTPKANKVVNWCDRINRTCVHAGDNIRTQVSFQKEQMRLENAPYGNR